MIDPLIIRMRVPLPVHEVLEFMFLAEMLCFSNILDLVLFFTIDDQWGACVGRAILLCLLIWKE